ncbi:unnamed protein product [Angiostrongylus costaricensis]|uniref:Str_synth domain-containing protein n=1 Tax=Angiostrongylus costaricensis TaxID=334426 RepID=A0A158PHJ2_ANGCS|nr:unnamed protein product [Angiostrongylus costaricensis]
MYSLTLLVKDPMIPNRFLKALRCYELKVLVISQLSYVPITCTMLSTAFYEPNQTTCISLNLAKNGSSREPQEQFWVLESCRWLAGVHCATKARHTAIQVMLYRSRELRLAVVANTWILRAGYLYAKFEAFIEKVHVFRPFQTLVSLHSASIAVLLLHIVFFGVIWYLIAYDLQYHFRFYFNADALPGNRYVNMVLMGASKFVMGLMPFAVSSWVGRRPIMLFSVVIASAGAWFALTSQLLAVSSGHWSLTAVSLVVSAALDPAWKINHLYSAELFPTVVRNMARAICNVGSRFGSVVAPMVVHLRAVHYLLPYLAFALFLTVQVLVVAVFLPETKDRPLPQELPETSTNRQDEQMMEQNPNVQNSIYTGLYDGRLVHIKNGKIIEEVRLTKAERCGSIDSEPICGRPLGIRRLNEHEMVVADAYFGVFVVNLSKGTFRHVVKSNTPIEGRFMRFLNDIEVLNEDEIIFTDSSSKWDRRHLFNIFLESEPNGRLNLQTNEVTPFAINLPGFPDNIRRGANGTLWVGMAVSKLTSEMIIEGEQKNNSYKGCYSTGIIDRSNSSGVRHIDSPSLIDALGSYTLFRQILLDVVPSHWWIKYLHMVRPAHAIIIQLDAQGEITQSLHDTKGTHIQDVSQVSQADDYLYLGSFHSKYIAKLHYSDM